MEITAIIAAAGAGVRFKGPKQFYRYRGRPLLHYCLAAFQRHPRIKRIILVLPRYYLSRIPRFINPCEFNKIQSIVAGGPRRQDSVRNGFLHVPVSSSVVIIHDGARPFVPGRLLDRGIALCRIHDGAVCGVPMTDTVKRVRGNRIVETIERRNLYLIQTPQFFKRAVLEHAYRTADFKRVYTDEACLVETTGAAVCLFSGDKRNIKITDRQDIFLLKTILC